MRLVSYFATRVWSPEMTHTKKPVNTVRQPVQRRSRQSVKAIVEASAQVLQQHGYKGATTNRIAERAGVSVGSLYQYFQGKDEIFDALIEQESKAYLSALKESMPGPNVPIHDGLRTLLEAGYAHQVMITGIREVLRVPQRRDQSVDPEPDPRPEPYRTARKARGGVSPRRRPCRRRGTRADPCIHLFPWTSLLPGWALSLHSEGLSHQPTSAGADLDSKSPSDRFGHLPRPRAHPRLHLHR